MTAILSLLLVVTLSILVTRIAAIALRHTGLSRQTARFQARSAFSGAGFTTSESEKVVNHPVRRRIVLTLMLLGNAGIVTAVSSLILAFVADDGSGDGFALVYKILLLVSGLVALWGVATSRWADRVLSRLIERALQRFTHLDVSDYEGLLHLAGDYRIVEMPVEPNGWVDGQALGELRPADEGILVLAMVTADGDWIGTPAGDTRPRSGDTLIVYGRSSAIQGLTTRRAGDERGHAEAVADQGLVADTERKRARPSASGSETTDGGGGA
jgi:hypothetical protein